MLCIYRANGDSKVQRSKRVSKVEWHSKDEVYLECVANETMRLAPPAQGTFWEVITDFTYEGFTIPKGWKVCYIQLCFQLVVKQKEKIYVSCPWLITTKIFIFLQTYWSVHTTNRNPKYFLDPEKFDPSRFGGKGPAPYTFVPFGGGPRLCPRKEYSWLEILVCIHNMVTRFKWEKVDPNEKVIYNNPSPILVNGLPIRLHPREK